MIPPAASHDPIADWLEEGPTSAPGQVLGTVLAAFPSIPQRRARQARWRFLAMSSLKLALAASIIGIILLGGSAVLPSLNSNAPVGASPSPSAAFPPTDCPSGAPLASGTIATIAGTDGSAPSADGALATAATIDPSWIAVDAQGTIYFTEGTTIRRVGTDGVLGTLTSGLEGPSGLAVDASGNIYFADNYVWIKKIDPSAKVTTVAGTGVNGSTGDEGSALSAQINAGSVGVGPKGDLYFDDANKFRTIDSAGVIHEFAGTGAHGFSGDGGPATQALIDDAYSGVWADSAGNVYIPDTANHRVRKVDPSGTINTVVGSGAAGSSGDGGPALKAALSGSQVQMTTDPAGNLYLADYSNNNVRKVDTAGNISLVAGKGFGYSGDCGPATQASLNAPISLAFHDGALYILDSGNHRIRMVVP